MGKAFVRESERFNLKVFAWVSLCYAMLSVFFLLPDSLQPHVGIAVATAFGPPALLGWGTTLLPIYFGTTAVLALLLYVGVRWSDEAGPFALAFAIVIWFGAGWISTAMSI
jgi:hypothetical protein